MNYKYINIKDLIGGDERFWSIKGETVHLSHHSYRNSPYETDSICDNCNGANCDGCKKIIDEARFEFGVPVDILERTIYKVAPELSAMEVKNLVYSDSCKYIYHDGEAYTIEYPTDAWLKENHPELVKKLLETWYFVEVLSKVSTDTNLFEYKREYYRFDNIDDAYRFTIEQESLKGIINGDVIINRYERPYVEIYRNHLYYGDVKVKYYDKVLKYSNGKLVE